MKYLRFTGCISAVILMMSCGDDSTSTDVSSSISTPTVVDERTKIIENNAGGQLRLPKAITNASDPGVGTLTDMDSFDFVAQMGAGWNLGNSLDVIDNSDQFLTEKTEWGNPLPTQGMINKVASTGFNTLRLPVSWRTNQSPRAPFQIQESYLERVKNVIDWAMANDMFVILNIHHDNEWLKPTESQKAGANARLKNTWTQIATYFEAYNEKLIFEVMNEPRLKNIPEEWNGGTVSGRRIVNEYTKTAVDAIRATAGNNANRQLMITPWAGSAINKAMDDLVIPNNDPNIIVTVHTYFPYKYALNGEGLWGTDQQKTDLINEFENIKRKWITEEKRPVILGEFSTRTDLTPVENRMLYAKFYVEEANKRGLMTILWDDGGNHGFLNRRTLSWKSDAELETIVEAAKVTRE